MSSEEVEYTEADAPLLRRAIRERWGLSPKVKQKAVECLEKVLDSDQARPKDITATVNALAKLDALNLRELEMTMPRRSLNINVDLSSLSEAELRAEIQRKMELLQQQGVDISKMLMDGPGNISQ